MTDYNTYVILDNIRSAENVGAIFRTADAVGVKKIFLVGITPAPLDRFGRVQPKIKKTALGAEESLAWESYDSIEELISRLHGEGVRVVAVEQDSQAVDYKDVTLTQDTAFVFGREVEGVSEDVLALCDAIVEIPMKGDKESLNVAVSVGVALYRMLGI